MLQSIYSRRLHQAVILIGVVILTVSCSTSSEDELTGNWSKTTPYKGRPRSGAFVFTIGSKAFVGLGYDGDDYLKDVYAYDVNSGFWENLAPFPGEARERGVAFSMNGKGYVGLGYNRDLDKEELGDFWEYDPNTNTWTRIADFGGTARYNSVAFALNGNGYVGTGYDGDSYNSDFWEYNPSTNSWREIVSYPGEKIEGGLAFTLDGRAFVCAGRNNGIYNTDFWEFNPEALQWTKRSPSTDADDYDDFKSAVARHDAVALVMGSYVYLVGGTVSSAASSTVYEFNSSNFQWRDKTEFEGASRSLAVGFVLEGRGFVGTGQSGTRRFDDVWEFKPNEDYDEDN